MISLPERFVLGLAAIGVVLTVVGIAAVAVQAVVLARRRRRREAVVVDLARSAFDGRPIAVSDSLGRLRPAVRAQILADLAGRLSGRDVVTLAALAEESGVDALSQRWCRSRRWRRRLRGAQFRTVLVPADAVTVQLLADPHPMVRSEAARASAGQPDPEMCRRLIAMLDDPEIACRLAATEALMHSNEHAAAEVVTALAVRRSPALRTDRLGERPRTAALLDIAAHLGDPRLLPVVLGHVADDRSEVRAAAANAVGVLGNVDSRSHVAAMLNDQSPAVRIRSTEALGRLASPSDAHLLATGLVDPVWEVREAGGLALERLGPVGRVYLRRIARRPDGLDSDMARRILDLPRPVGDTSGVAA